MVEQGIQLARQGRHDDAVSAYERAIAAEPGMAEAHYNLGVAHRARGRMDQAAECWRRAIQLRPDFIAAHNNLGSALLELGQIDQAIAAHRRALELDPRSLPALINLGNALRQAGRPDDAAQVYRGALALKPDDPMAHGNLGLALQDLGALDESEAEYRRALALRPDYADAHRNLGMLLLLKGRFAEGWAAYRWRWQTRWHPRRKFPFPAWDGGDVAGKRVLLHAEQGLGDTIMFSRLAASLTARGARVTLEVQASLLRLLEGLRGVERIVPAGTPLEEFDLEAPLLDVPGLLGLDTGNIPAETPYLRARPERVARWRAMLDGRPGLKVGVVWQGNPKSIADLGRSPPLKAFAPLAELAGVRLIGLQKADGRDQLADLPLVEDYGPQIDNGPDAFIDTAAIMQGMDLVITADTASAHLAGALGRPCWIVLKSVPDWRWMLERNDTPWYPTSLLFRQRRAGDWDELFRRVADALAARVHGSTG
jgi:Flp pilus assembly protein TadD